MNLTKTETKYLKIFNKKHILLPTKHKKPLVKGWNNYYQEKRTIEQLLTLNNEYSLRTGIKVTNDYYFVALDLDDEWAQERIKDTRYILTNKGIHRYFLIKELPKSCFLLNKYGRGIGELHSKGRFVVGIGSIHQLGTRYSLKGRSNIKFSLKFEKLTELQEYLAERNIFSAGWGKTGAENFRSLEVYKPKKLKQKLTKQQVYYQKKAQLEKSVNQQKSNICYLCLVSFKKKSTIIKSHLSGKQHREKWKTYQNEKVLSKNLY